MVWAPDAGAAGVGADDVALRRRQQVAGRRGPPRQGLRRLEQPRVLCGAAGREGPQEEGEGLGGSGGPLLSPQG